MLVSLDLQFFSGEKTEKATPKKHQDVRKKGQVAKSQDVNTAVLLLAVFMYLWVAGRSSLDILLSIFRASFQDRMLTELTEDSVFPLLTEILLEMFYILGPILVVAMLAGIVANYFQVGFLFSPEAIHFKLEKLNPIQGVKRIISIRSIVELIKSILKITFVGSITMAILMNSKEEIMILAQKSVGSSLVILATITAQMGLAAAGGLLFLAFLDYFYQRYDFEKNIRMSKQEIKEEYKNIEGDPLIKSKIKQRQREMAMSRMMQEIPKADVVITNPTHYAIALKYDEKKLDAPYVVAKGVDFLAQKIKLIAKENEVVTMENRTLARALYNQAEIGDPIPEEFFKAVAEILAFVYRTRTKSKN